MIKFYSRSVLFQTPRVTILSEKSIQFKVILIFKSNDIILYSVVLMQLFCVKKLLSDNSDIFSTNCIFTSGDFILMTRSDIINRLTRLAAMSALSIVLVLIVHFPLFPSAPFLEYDPADVPVLIAGFMYGPWWGLLTAAVVSIIQGITVSASSGWIGILMHFLATGAFVLISSIIYRSGRGTKKAVIGLAAGCFSMAAVMALCNLVFTPLFMGQSLSTVAAMLVPIIIPFNLLKSGINSIITFLLFKPLSKLFK